MLASDYKNYKQIFRDVLVVPDTIPGTTTVEKNVSRQTLGTLGTEGDDAVKAFLPFPSLPVKINYNDQRHQHCILALCSSAYKSNIVLCLLLQDHHS